MVFISTIKNINYKNREMKQQFIYYAHVFIFLISLISCEKVIESTNDAPVVYLPMSVGNYWIYQHYKIDSLGNEMPLRNYTDSVYIVKDSIINGDRYYKFESSIYFEKFKGFFRDSCGHLIKSTGEIIFSATNFVDTIRYEYGYNKPYGANRLLYYLIKSKMNPVKQFVNTPLDNYNALMINDFLTFYYYDWSGNMIDTLNTSLNTYFAPNIGMVKDTYRYYRETKQEKSKVERRLLRYKINN